MQVILCARYLIQTLILPCVTILMLGGVNGSAALYVTKVVSADTNCGRGFGRGGEYAGEA